jgi:hypothetical protein
MVVSDIIRAFKEEFGLIEPKPFCFTGNIQNQDETELCEIGMFGRPSVTYEIKVK